MSLFGMFKKQEPSGFMIHPEAARHFGSVMSYWVRGAQVEVLNPQTQQWELTNTPAFDPQYKYRIVHDDLRHLVDMDMTAHNRAMDAAAQVAAKPLKDEIAMLKRELDAMQRTVAATKATQTPVSVADSQATTYYAGNGPQHMNKFKRGQIWKARNGQKYIVLANKMSRLPRDKAMFDGGMPLVVARYDDGMKVAATHRFLDGTRKHDSSLDLVEMVGSDTLGGIPCNSAGTHEILFTRKKDCIGLNLRTGETQVISK